MYCIKWFCCKKSHLIKLIAKRSICENVTFTCESLVHVAHLRYFKKRHLATFLFCMWYGVAPRTYLSLQYGPSFSMKKHMLTLHMGATKLADFNLNFYSKSKNPTFKSSMHMSYIVQTRCCYIAKKKWAKNRSCIIGCFTWEVKIVQFLHDSKLFNSYKHEVEDLSLYIVHVSYIFIYYISYLICYVKPIDMSKVLSYGKSSKVKNFWEYMPTTKGRCLSRELQSLFF